MDNSINKTKKKHIWKKILVIILILMVLIGITGTVWFYDKYQEVKNNPSIASQEEIEALIKQIGELMVLPTGEDPTVATVTDKTKLTDQTFFKDAQNGDKLLAYTVAQKAILYRPSTKQIVNIAPFNISSTTTDTDSSN